MDKNLVYSCPKCKALLVLPSSTWIKVVKCPTCGCFIPRSLNEEFDLSEIIKEDKK